MFMGCWAASISVFVDNTEYCRFDASTNRQVKGERPTGADAWQKFGGPMAPFDRAFYMVLGVGLGGFHDFSDAPDQRYRSPKPWHNQDVNAKRAFWSVVGEQRHWPGETAPLLVDYVRVYAL